MEDQVKKDGESTSEAAKRIVENARNMRWGWKKIGLYAVGAVVVVGGGYLTYRWLASKPAAMLDVAKATV